MIERHTGRGRNLYCDCEYCVAKRDATQTLSNAHKLMQNADALGVPNPSSLRAYMLDPDAIGNWIWMLRRAARREVRKTLKQLKQK